MSEKLLAGLGIILRRFRLGTGVDLCSSVLHGRLRLLLSERADMESLVVCASRLITGHGHRGRPGADFGCLDDQVCYRIGGGGVFGDGWVCAERPCI